MSRTFNRNQMRQFALFINRVNQKQTVEASYYSLVEAGIELVVRAKSIRFAFERECNGIRKTIDQEYTIPPSLKKLYRTIEVPDPEGEKRNEERANRMIEECRKIAAEIGFAVYVQGDPRGCPIYLYLADEVKEGYRIDSLYQTIGIPVPID